MHGASSDSGRAQESCNSEGTVSQARHQGLCLGYDGGMPEPSSHLDKVEKDGRFRSCGDGRRGALHQAKD